MSTCSNCKAKLSCGCQKRKASDGQQVCSNCLARYETKIKGTQPKDNLKKSTK
jgi:hypothetical protein